MNITFNPGDRLDSFGHHFIVGLSGTTLSEEDKQVLGRIKPCGIILFARNFDSSLAYPAWLEKLHGLIEAAKAYAERDEMIVSIDHEGGRVHRPPAPMTRFPAAVKYAPFATEVAKAMGRELRSLGVNIDWAPVCDINSNPANPVIGDRALADNAAKVSAAALDFAEGLRSCQIAACAKHFPGHGDTEKDSHLELPLLNISEKELFKRELVPFRALIEADVPLVMTAHIMFPQLDALWPATLSVKILDEILRKRLGFSGVIVSDDLDMKAVSERFKQDGTLGQALNAGCEMFIVARNPDVGAAKALGLADAAGKCLSSRLVSEDRFYQSFLRIERLFNSKLYFHTPEALQAEVFEEHSALLQQIEEQSQS
jgi:beta-N-acetylhexosaminidase